MLDKSLFKWISIRGTNNVIHWKRIYTVDSVIYLSYNLTLVDKCYSTFEQPGHGVLIDKYLNASVSPGSRHVVSL